MGSRVLLRRDSTVLRKSYLKDGVHTRARAMFDDTAGGPSMLMRGQYDPSLEINYVDDPRLAVGEVFTRATIRTVRDFEGRTLVLNSGEVGFWGMRRVANLFTNTEAITAPNWPITWGGSDSITPETVIRDPQGGMFAFRSRATLGGSGRGQALTTVAGRTYCISGWVYVPPGESGVSVRFGPSDGSAIRSSVNVTKTGEWVFASNIYVCSTSETIAAGFTSVGALGTFLLFRPQLEDISGQSLQGPSEYVSVGVLPAPYHGANVDGVRYFVTQPNGTLIPRYTGDTIKYFQNVAAAGYASTPDAAALSPTGAFALIWRGNLNNVSGTGELVLKWNGITIQYALSLNSGPIYLRFHDGVALRSGTSSVNLSTVTQNGQDVSLAVVLNPTPGGAIYDFYYRRSDTDPWSALGSRVTSAGVAGPAAQVSPLSVASGSGASAAAGVHYYAELRSGGLTGARLARFDANDASAAGAASFVSSTTGETWTINGNGTTSRVNTWTKPARCGLFHERASTNVQIKAEQKDDAAWNKASATVTADAIAGVSGALTGDAIVATAAFGNVNSTSAKAASSLSYTQTEYLRAGTVAGVRLGVFDTNAFANGVQTSYNLLLGTTSAFSPAGVGWAGVSTTMEQVQPGVWRCSLTATTDAAATINAFVAHTSTAIAGDIFYALGAQLENLDHPTSFIPTTTVAVTRNKDAVSLALDATKWFNAAEGTVAVEGFPNYVGGGISESVDLSDGTSSNSMRLSRQTASGVWGIVNGGAVQASISNGNWITTAQKRAAGAYKANDFQQAFDGVLGTQDTAGTVPTVTTLTIGDRGAGGFEWDGCLGRIHYFPQRMPDSRLTSLPAGSV